METCRRQHGKTVDVRASVIEIGPLVAAKRFEYPVQPKVTKYDHDPAGTGWCGEGKANKQPGSARYPDHHDPIRKRN